MALTAVDNNEYFFAQSNGEADVVSAGIAAGANALSLTKGANGKVNVAGEGHQIIAHHTRDRSGAITDNDIIAVTLVMGNLI